MPSNALLVQPDGAQMDDVEALYRQLMQIAGRDLGLEGWGSLINHVDYDSDAEYAHTLRNNGTGGHLNIPGQLQVKSDGTGTFITTLTATTFNATTINAATVNVTTLLNSTGNSVLGNGDGDVNTFIGVSTFRNAANTAVQLFIDAANNRVIIGSNTALGSASNDKFTVAGGTAYFAGPSGSAIGIRYNASQAVGWLLGVDGAGANKDLLFLDDGAAEILRVGDTSSTYQLRVTGDLNVTDDAVIAGDISGDRVVIGGTTFSGSEKLRVVGSTRAEGSITVTTGGIGVTGSSVFNSGLSVLSGLTVTTGGLQIDAGGIDLNAGGLTMDAGQTATFNGAAAFNDPVTFTDTPQIVGTDLDLSTAYIDFDLGSSAGFTEDTWGGHIQAKHDGTVIYIPYLSSPP